MHKQLKSHVLQRTYIPDLKTCKHFVPANNNDLFIDRRHIKCNYITNLLNGGIEVTLASKQARANTVLIWSLMPCELYLWFLTLI